MAAFYALTGFCEGGCQGEGFRFIRAGKAIELADVSRSPKFGILLAMNDK